MPRERKRPSRLSLNGGSTAGRMRLAATIRAQGAQRRRDLPDEEEEIARHLREIVDGGNIDLLITTGGTGFSPRDVTPEATRRVIEREAPGLAELMRTTSLQITPLAALSRSVCGIRGRTLIINLPGSVRGARENLQAVIRLLPNAIALLQE